MEILCKNLIPNAVMKNGLKHAGMLYLEAVEGEEDENFLLVC